MGPNYPSTPEDVGYSYIANTNKLSSVFYAGAVYGTTNGSKAFAFDANGNVSQDLLLKRNFQWDPYNKLVLATTAGGPPVAPIVSYLYIVHFLCF